MAFDAGSVTATLSGRFNAAGFHQFSSAMYKARAEMDATEKRQQEMAARSAAASEKIGHGAKVVAAGGILALAGVIGGSIKVAVDFEKQMRNVNSIAGLNERQFRSLRQEILGLAGPTAQTPKTLAAGLYQLVSSGFKADDALKILKASAVAATAGLTTTEVATTAVAAALNAYHLPASQAQKVTDILFQTVNRGVITFEELAQTIGTVLPFSNSLHVDLAQVGASISTLTKEGIPAANATTYLKNAMVAFLKPSDAMKTAIKATGSASGEQLVKTKGFQGALEAVAKTTDGTKAALQRLLAGGDLITDKNAAAIAHLASVYGQLPKNVRTKIDAEPQSALAKIGTLLSKLHGVDKARTVAKIYTNAATPATQVLALRAIIAGVPPRKVFHIIGDHTLTAKGEVDALRGAIAAIPTSKTFTLYERRVIQGALSSPGAGFGPQPGNPPSLNPPPKKKAPPAAAGGKTTGPQLYLVGEGRDPVEWIIPRDPQHRGRAVSLLMDAAKSILPAAAGGAKHGATKPKAHPPRYVPKHLDALSLSVDDFTAREQAAKDKLDKVHSTIEQLPGQISSLKASIRDIERRSAKTTAQKANKADDLARAKKKLAGLESTLGNARAAEPHRRADAKEAHDELAAAKSYAARIQKQQDLADIAGDAMQLADKQNDQKAYDKALGRYQKALADRKTLLKDALGHIRKGTPYYREIQKALGQVANDIQDASTATSTADQSQQQADQQQGDTGFTAAESSQLSDINRDAALAALTPDLGDDQDAAQRKVSLLEQVLAEVRPGGARPAPSDIVATIADQVKSARDNLTSLTNPNGGGTNDNPDLQAQLDQARGQVTAAQREAAINAAWATAAGGPGDIGSGTSPSSARQAVQDGGLHVHFESYVPPSPDQARELAGHVVRGLGYQGFRRNNRETVFLGGRGVASGRGQSLP